MTQNFSSPMANFYRGQMNGISNPMNFMPSYQMPQFQNPIFQQPQQQTQQTGFPCRPVTSIEEARGAIIDASAPYVFTNLGNNEIYTKCVLSDGTAKLNRYILAPEQQPQQQPQNDIEQLKAQIIAHNEAIIKLNDEILAIKGGAKNDELTTTNGKSISNTKNSK